MTNQKRMKKIISGHFHTKIEREEAKIDTTDLRIRYNKNQNQCWDKTK